MYSTDNTFDIPVTYTGMTYQAKAPNKMSATCTAGAEQAAKALAQKIWGDDFISLKSVPELSDDKKSIWRVTFKPDAIEPAPAQVVTPFEPVPVQRFDPYSGR